MKTFPLSDPKERAVGAAFTAIILVVFALLLYGVRNQIGLLIFCALCVVLIGQIRIQDAHRRHALGAHGLRRDIRTVMILLDHLAHAFLRFLGKTPVFMNDTRYRRHRDPGKLGNFSQ